MAVFRNLPIAIPDSYTTLPHFGSNAPIAIVVGGNRFAYDTLRMHADVSKVIPKMDCFRDIFGRVIAESTADKSRGRAEGYEESGQGRAGHRHAPIRVGTQSIV